MDVCVAFVRVVFQFVFANDVPTILQLSVAMDGEFYEQPRVPGFPTITGEVYDHANRQRGSTKEEGARRRWNTFRRGPQTTDTVERTFTQDQHEQFEPVKNLFLHVIAKTTPKEEMSNAGSYLEE